MGGPTSLRYTSELRRASDGLSDHFSPAEAHMQFERRRELWAVTRSEMESHLHFLRVPRPYEHMGGGLGDYTHKTHFKKRASSILSE